MKVLLLPYVHVLPVFSLRRVSFMYWLVIEVFFKYLILHTYYRHTWLVFILLYIYLSQNLYKSIELFQVVAHTHTVL